MDISVISMSISYPTKPIIPYTAPIIPYDGDFRSLLYKKKTGDFGDFGGFHRDFVCRIQPHPTRLFLTLTYPKWPHKGDFGGDFGILVNRDNAGISRTVNCDHMVFQNTKWQPTAPQVAPLAVCCLILWNTNT